MSEKTEGSSGFKKKYLYLDKFEKYKEEQNVWRLSTNDKLADLKKRVNTGALWSLVLTLAVLALWFFK
jgi:hypothetical protein